MRFSHKQYPILADYMQQKITIQAGLQRKMATLSTTGETGQMLSDFHQFTTQMLSHQNFYYIAKPIAERMVTDGVLGDKLFLLLHELQSDSGIFLLPASKRHKGIRYCCYQVVNHDDYSSYQLGIGLAEGLEGFIEGSIAEGPNDNLHLQLSFMLAEHYPIDETTRAWVQATCYFILKTILFKQYAPIETNIIQQGQANVARKITINNEKYLNETRIPIQIIDSNWFTNIIRKEGFNVRGHMALRAYGKGRAKRKLVWIDTYQKSGYERQAGRIRDGLHG